MIPPRHRWSAPVRFAHKTERTCLGCGLVKVTRHEPAACWTEWWLHLDRIKVGSGVPVACGRTDFAASLCPDGEGYRALPSDGAPR